MLVEKQQKICYKSLGSYIDQEQNKIQKDKYQ